MHNVTFNEKGIIFITHYRFLQEFRIKDIVANEESEFEI